MGMLTALITFGTTYAQRVNAIYLLKIIIWDIHEFLLTL